MAPHIDLSNQDEPEEYPPLPWISAGNHAVRTRAAEWLRSPSLQRVLDVFGGADIRVDTDDPETLTRLRRWSRSRLDSRAGRERHEAQHTEYSPLQVRVLREAAGPLGLLRTFAPAHSDYDLTIVLGGTVTGNEVRAGYAFEMQAKGVHLGKLVGAGAYRPLSPAEKTAAADSGAPPAARVQEYDHLAWVLSRFTSADHRRMVREQGKADTFSSSRIEVLERAGVPAAFLAQAPSRRPSRRADTLDAVLFARAELDAAAGQTLVITSSLYAPYSFFLLAPHATPEGHIEVVGTPTEISQQPARQAQRFAQEIHSTLSVLPT